MRDVPISNCEREFLLAIIGEKKVKLKVWLSLFFLGHGQQPRSDKTCYDFTLLLLCNVLVLLLLLLLLLVLLLVFLRYHLPCFSL